MTTNMIWSQNSPKRGFLTPFWSIFRPEKGQNGPQLLFFTFSSKNHFQTGVYKWANLKIYVSEHIFGPNNGRNGQETLFSSHFHPKTIPKQGSYAYISPNLKKYVFGLQKRIFDPFAHIFGPEKGQNSFSVIFIQKTIPKRGYIPMFHC